MRTTSLVRIGSTLRVSNVVLPLSQARGGRRRYLGCTLVWLGLVAMYCGCGSSEKPKGSGPSRIQYTDKTPEEWVELIQHKSTAARNRALDAIISYQKDGKDMVSLLIPPLKTAKTDARLSVARCLGEMRGDAAAAVPALAEALGDKSWRHRDGAAKSIGMIGAAPETAIPALLAAMQDSDNRVRGEAANALGAYRDHAAQIVPELIPMLQDKDPFTIPPVCDGLGKLGPAARQAAPALKKLKKHRDFSVRAAAEDALRNIQGR